MNPHYISKHHSFDVELAAKHGIPAAILIHHLAHWISYNKTLKKNFIEGRTWTYQTIQQIAAHFSYLSIKQVERLLNKLVKQGLIIKGNFNKSAYDRTRWYAFKNEAEFFPNEEFHFPKSGNENPEIGRPIPDTKTYAENKEKKERVLSKEKPEVSKVNSAEKKKYGEFQHVELSYEEHEKLKTRWGEEELSAKIISLDLYIESVGTKKANYKSHYATLLRWNLSDKTQKTTGYTKNQKERPKAFENENSDVGGWKPKRMNEKGEWI